MKIALLVLFSVAGLRAQEVSAVARLDSTRFLVGDPIPVSISLSHPAGTLFTPLIGDTVGTFAVLQPPSMSPKGETASNLALVLSRYDSGDVEIPSIRLSYILPGDTAVNVVATRPLAVSLSLVGIDTTQPIRDLKPPIDVPMTLAEMALIAGIVLVIVALAFFAYRFWKKRRKGEAAPVEAERIRPAHMIALEELGLLKEKRLWQQGLTKEYYSEVTEIVRRYFENRFHVMALEQTTDEILSTLTPHVRSSGLLRQIGEFLNRADLVKFAKFSPGIPENEETLTLAYEIVGKTKGDVPEEIPAGVTEVEEHARV